MRLLFPLLSAAALAGCVLVGDVPNPDGATCDDAAPSTWYADLDGDGLGDAGATTEACEPRDGFVGEPGDCDDGDPDVGGTGDLYADVDGDGWGDAAADQGCPSPGFAARGEDCDDDDASVYPGAVERCEAADVDADCDGDVAADDTDTVDLVEVWPDADGDGFGDESTAAAPGCAGASRAVVGGDCDDAAAGTNPGATEVCGAEDEDCDGAVDGDDDSLQVDLTWYTDGDGDGYGVGDGRPGCEGAEDEAAVGDDCDDADGAVFPGASEVCDGVDDDCDGAVDADDVDVADAVIAYEDGDGDGYGEDATAVAACDVGAGWVEVGGDCDDAAAAVWPGADEVCGGDDDDCDGLVDDDDPGLTGAGTWYTDGDGDGYGDATGPTTACTAPAGTVADGTDCDDTTAGVSPAASETCEDGVDQDCDGIPTGCGLFGDADLGDADAIRSGSSSVGAGRFGEALAVAGDWDGDGDDELIVGAYYSDVGVSNSGSAFVFEGPFSGTATSNVATAGIHASAASDWVGASVAGGGDFDGDGLPDVVTSGDDRLSVFFGAFSGSTTLASADVSISVDTEILAFVGDQDADGDDDLLVGGLYLIPGGTSSTRSASSATATLLEESGSSGGDGPDVASAGDVNGDGVEDVLIGDDYTDTWGAVYVLHGPVSGSIDLGTGADVRMTWSVLGEHVGDAVAGGGDVDGDGYADVLAGAMYQDGGRGGAWLITAADLADGDLATVSTALLTGAGSSDWAGWDVALADLDADGHHDVVVSAPEASTAATGGGVVHVVRGPVTGTVSLADSDLALGCPETYGSAGEEMAVGDLDGDGRDDLAIGAQGVSSSTGSVYLLYGTSF